jgi:2-polyprenyl-6-methoxyphenol hydroxylase-like FAD-dependent oxidoreductase
VGKAWNPNMNLPIIIAGAGPSGLTLALELARRNIGFEIFDKANGPAPENESRALAFNPRSQAILKASGVTELVCQQGHTIEKIQFCWESRPIKTIAGYPSTRADLRIVSIPQGSVERALITALEKLGIQINWNSEITNFTQTSGDVTADIHKNGKSISMKGRYLIGCDGAHSIVRKQGGYQFSGTSDPQVWELADIVLNTDEFAHMMVADLFPGGANAFIPINDRFGRIIHAGIGKIDNHPMMVHASKTAWKSQFKVSYRMVRQFSRKNTFLCGDAAHIHSPVGGRGMNLGIEDAATLAFLIQQNREKEYSALRLPIANSVLKFTRTQTNQLLSKSPFNHLVKKHILPVALSISPLRNYIQKSILALDTPSPEWL